MPYGSGEMIDEMIEEVKAINKALIALKEENTMLKKEIVRLKWMLEHQD
jgi:regulator of replication initiation timing